MSKVIVLLSDSDSENGEDDGVVEVTQPVPRMKQFSICVPGKPQSMPRPTFMSWFRNGKLVRRVVQKASKRKVEFREAVMRQLADQHGSERLTQPLYSEGPVAIHIVFCIRPPNSFFVSNNRSNPLCEQHSPVTAHTGTPDIDNLAKFVLDALTGVVYKDDKQVAKTLQLKVWDNKAPHNGRTLIMFKQLNEQSDLPITLEAADTL
jgi:Holliday junction resolvase RusA-like endonuclease